MPNSKKPDFSRAYSKANEILVKSSAIQTFPFSPKDLVKEQTPIVCRSFKKARKYGVDITAFGSESATRSIFPSDNTSFFLNHCRQNRITDKGHNQSSAECAQKTIFEHQIIFHPAGTDRHRCMSGGCRCCPG